MAKRKPAKTASKKTTTTTKTKARTKKAGEVLIVQSKFKEALKAHGVNVASDAMTGLNDMVHWYVSQAANRAKSNGRKTVRAHDFMS
jgi:histone H3/H4